MGGLASISHFCPIEIDNNPLYTRMYYYYYFNYHPNKEHVCLSLNITDPYFPQVDLFSHKHEDKGSSCRRRRRLDSRQA